MKRLTVAVLGVALVGLVAGCGSSRSGGSTSAPAGSLGTPCYITLTENVTGLTEYVAVALASGQDCGSIGTDMQQVFQNATVTTDYMAKPWSAGNGFSAACMGLLTSAKDRPPW